MMLIALAQCAQSVSILGEYEWATGTYTRQVKQVVTVGQYAFVAASQHGLDILDMNGAGTPIHLGSLNPNAPSPAMTCRTVQALNHNEVYLGCADGWRLINTQNKAAPFIQAPAAPATTGFGGDARSLFVDTNAVYAGKFALSGTCLVYTYTHAGVVLGAATCSGTGVKEVYADGNTLYVTSVAGTSGVSYLNIYDVTNPAANPTPYSPVTQLCAGAAGFKVVAQGSTKVLYVAGATELQVWDVTNPTAVVLLGSTSVLHPVLNVDVVGNMLLAAGRDLEIYDVADNVAPAHVQTIPINAPVAPILYYSGVVEDVVIDGSVVRLIFSGTTPAGGEAGFKTLDFSTPAPPPTPVPVVPIAAPRAPVDLTPAGGNPPTPPTPPTPPFDEKTAEKSMRQP